MHNDIAIRAEDISKKFCRSLRHVMVYGVQDIARNTFGMSSRSEVLREGEFWAVNDISFEVKKGETLGIIGANGSGKSTLLKLLNGIFMPDKGRIEIKGRVGALIEVGAGFHPMLTGRENIYVNGAILGMSKKEIDRKFADIVAFADIGDFIDSPVKHYSSGMYVRLGFAVAVHSDPDILLIDEVLAVGDASFQNKCFKKLSEFKKEGKTIILVTHDMDAIVKHCDSAILLGNGIIEKRGKPNEVVNRYIDLVEGRRSRSNISNIETANLAPENSTAVSDMDVTSELEKFLNEGPIGDNCINRQNYNKDEYRYGDKSAEIMDYLVVLGENHDPVIIRSGDVVDIYLKVKFHRPVASPLFGFSIKTVDGVSIYGSNTQFSKIPIKPAKSADVLIMKISIGMKLHAGDYFVDIGVGEELIAGVEPLDRRCGIIHLKVQERNTFYGFVELDTNYKEIRLNETT